MQGHSSPKVPFVPQMPFFSPFARWDHGKSRSSTYTNSEQLRVCRLLGPGFFPFRVLPKDSLIAVSRAPVDAMLTVWLSFWVFTGRDWSRLFLGYESLAMCYFEF